jgi:hypothetical protein
MTMITIKTDRVKECGYYDKMCTTVEIEGDSIIIKEEIKTLLQRCKKDARLRGVVIQAISEVLHDN